MPPLRIMSILQEFDGKVSELIRRSENSAQKLVCLLVQYFPSFRDVGMYRGRKGKGSLSASTPG